MSYAIDRNNLPQVNFQDLKTRAPCLNIAQDCVDISNEDRAVAAKIHDFILRVLYFSSIALIGAVAAVGILSPAVPIALIVVGTLAELPTLLVIHSLWKRGTYLERAQKLEVMAMMANRRAAELAPWSDSMGVVTLILTALFGGSNPVTKFGKDTIGGKRESSSYYL